MAVLEPFECVLPPLGALTYDPRLRAARRGHGYMPSLPVFSLCEVVVEEIML